MVKNLFGEITRDKNPKYTRTLQKYDKDSFADRLKRLNWLKDNFPEDFEMLCTFEILFLLKEAKMTFINGEFVATILLTVSAIEHRLQSLLLNKGYVKESKKGLKYILKFMRENGLLSDYLFKSIDKLRLFRNPFVHLKSYKDENCISERVMTEFSPPETILEREAKMALNLMYTIYTQNLN